MRVVKTILVVEDDRSLRQLLRLVLEQEFDARVVEAPDGGAALEAVRRERPDLVVLDMMLPVINGLEVARRLRAAPDWAALPIMGLSALVDGSEAQEAGCSAFLSKPFDLDDLLRVLNAYLRPMSGGAICPDLLRARLAGERVRLFREVFGHCRAQTAAVQRRCRLARRRTRALVALAQAGPARLAASST